MLRGAKVVVVFPPVSVSPDFIDYPYFADLGAIQTAATLRAAGAEVTLADAFALAGSTLTPATSDLLLGAPEDELFAGIPASADVFVVALTPFHRPPGRDDALGSTLARLRREHPHTPLVLADLYQSGQHVVDAASADIAASYPEVDALLRYEAEADLPAIVADLIAKGRPATPLLAVGSELPRLDDLPLPAWDLVDLPAYFRFHERVTARLGRPSWAFPITEHSAPVLTSRGCPYRCVHCSSNPSTRREGVQIAPKTQRRHSPAHLDRLFGDLAARGVRRVHLLDELVNVNEAHFDAVLDLLRKHRLSFEIPNGLRADYVLPGHLERMRGNLTTLSVSAESGVQSVVDRIVDKKLDLQAILTVAENAREARVPLLVHFMIGLPGETRQDIQGTLAFALDLFEKHGALPSVQFATPLPGTRLSRLAHDSTPPRDPVSSPAAPAQGNAPGASGVVLASGAPGADARRALPVVRDWGPLFQQVPSTRTAAFTPEYLRLARWTFDRRMDAARGRKRVVLDLTYRCNNHCPFCATGTHALPDPEPARRRELLVRHRKLGATALDIDGGEPTLSDRLLPTITFARKLGYEHITVTTNGRMAAYPDFADRLLKSGISTLFVSLHGPDEATHAANVGVAGAFDQTLTGIRHLVRLATRPLDATTRPLGVVTRPLDAATRPLNAVSQALPAGHAARVSLGAKLTITRFNQDKLFETATLVESLGLRRLDMQFLTPFGPGSRALAPDEETALREVRRTLHAFAGRLDLRIANLPYCLLPGDEDHLDADVADLAGRLATADDDVDLLAYLRARRTRKPVCDTCPHTLGCAGFFDLDAAPEPPWLLPAKSLVRAPTAP